ncbi:MAG TPA: hypothetical protein VFA77_16315 [Candidatus Eisenbacteria bacterium]|jgi:hypothetical protein|nr:hypothetical protein [Candidatus Eisenbacteria bacterium]
MNDFSNTTACRRRSLWREAFRQPSVWRRAFTLGLTVGALQAAINQGDFWWHNAVDKIVLTKTIASPLIGFTLVLVSSAQTWVEKTIHKW